MSEFASTDISQKAAPARSKTSSSNASQLQRLTDAVHRYFDLMYDCDTARFDSVFARTVNLHGYRDGKLVAWSAGVYRDILEKRISPKSRGAARADEILTIDLASQDMAFVKVRLQINEMVFVDYLTWHEIDGAWLVTSKGFHLQSS